MAMFASSIRLARRFFFYTLAGSSTFILDLSLLYLATTYFDMPRVLAVSSCFFIAVSINYLLCYHLVYRGTTQHEGRGYLYFLLFALIGIMVIVTTTETLISLFHLPLLVARVLVGVLVGILNFILNTFLNFRLI